MTGCPCQTCKHFDLDTKDKDACAAFPDGIPPDILLNKHNHRTPFAGDHGIQWELRAEFAWMKEQAG